MKKLSTNEIRKVWLDFFEEKGHHVEESKSLVPVNDNSLLFINSGVATLKKYFDGSELPPKNRIANAQKSIRTNDIENVGVTSRHHTLFEMLGNFSIGDYFKEESIQWAYEILTDPKWFGFDVDKLYFTIHPNDQVAHDCWVQLGISPERIIRLEENFWEIGPGPGGPNTEIFYDRGASYDDRDPVLLIEKDLENDRVIEIWNIVFSQYNCNPGVIPINEYPELPQKNIDTGMGLERMACVIQGVETNFETDNFMYIIQQLVNKTNINYLDKKMAYRVIADHIRALTFAIADGALPSNEGRGYVLRRILRRAIRFGYHDLGLNEPFLNELCDAVIHVSKEFYPYLDENVDFIKKVITGEEKKFFTTISDGITLLDREITRLEGNIIGGEVAFKLYDTYGFPIELTVEIAEEKGITVDIEGYNTELEAQRERARNAANNNAGMEKQNPVFKEITVASEFIGYDQLSIETKIVAITDLEKVLDHLDCEFGYVVLDKCPFYAESGGQLCDYGYVADHQVVDVQKIANGQFLIKLVLNGKIELGEVVTATVDKQRRDLITSNHSATHLLHMALVEVVGPHANQAGSLQDDLKTRFDFTNLEGLTIQELSRVELIVNDAIKANEDVIIKEMPIADAKAMGAHAMFGEKYGAIVRVVKMGDSIELCGGTHVKSTGEIKYFHILSEGGIGSGVRRIEAITNENVVLYSQQLVSEISSELTDAENNITNKVVVSINELEKKILRLKKVDIVYPSNSTFMYERFDQVLKDLEILKNEIASAAKNQVSGLVDELSKHAVSIDGIMQIDQEVSGIDMKDFRDLCDQLINKLSSGVVIIRLIEDNKVSIIVKVSQDLKQEHNASNILKSIIEPFGGRGGGKPDMAQGGYTK
jgi:alanyl-tRNA synthetase